METKPHQIASQRKRYHNYLLDDLVFRFTVILTLILGIFTYQTLGPFWNKILIVIPISCLIANFIILQWLTGKSIGKFLTHTKVVSIDGNKATFHQILIRETVKLFPFEFLSLLDSRFPTGYADRLSNTKVIYDGKTDYLAHEGTSAISPDLSKKNELTRLIALLVILCIVIAIYLVVRINS